MTGSAPSRDQLLVFLSVLVFAALLLPVGETFIHLFQTFFDKVPLAFDCVSSFL